MAKKLSNTNLVWLSEQEHIGTEDVEAIIGKFEDRTVRPKANKYRRARGISSYKRSLVSEQNKMDREETRQLERAELLDPLAMADAIGRTI